MPIGLPVCHRLLLIYNEKHGSYHVLLIKSTMVMAILDNFSLLCLEFFVSTGCISCIDNNGANNVDISTNTCFAVEISLWV